MNEKLTGHNLVTTLSRRFFVRKKNIIDTSSYCLISIATKTETSIIKSSNQNCFANANPKQISISSIEDRNASKSNERLPLFYDIISNAWPISTECVENLRISKKRCQFSNEPISIKPITASIYNK